MNRYIDARVLKKIILSALFLSTSLLAAVINEYPSEKILLSKTPIIDVRTPAEWKETGLLKGAIPIMFFNEQGAYNVETFLKELTAKVDTTKPFALICRTGSRTKIISNFLSKEFGYEVINLQGGMMFVKGKNLPVIPYK
ncbi:rhodanese-like domain-containing protein [bacterium]|nr:rhodanese-like domain-containing protein [bacterium]MBU1990152.1 rhodanese-like domain-containing protein [bacterium]